MLHEALRPVRRILAFPKSEIECMKKQTVLEAMQQLPDDFEAEDLFERVLFVQLLKDRLAESDQGQSVSFEEAKKRFYPIAQPDAA